MKEIFKTSKGKYIAPAPIENILNNSNYVELSCVSGSGFPQPYAQVVIAEDLRDKLDDAGTRDEISKALEALLLEVNGKVEHHEQLQQIDESGHGPFLVQSQRDVVSDTKAFVAYGVAVLTVKKTPPGLTGQSAR